MSTKNLVYRQTGIVYETVNDTDVHFYAPEVLDKDTVCLFTGSISNLSGGGYVIKIISQEFEQQFVKITMAANEVLTIKNLQVSAFQCLTTNDNLELLFVKTIMSRELAAGKTAEIYKR